MKGFLGCFSIYFFTFLFFLIQKKKREGLYLLNKKYKKDFISLLIYFHFIEEPKYFLFYIFPNKNPKKNDFISLFLEYEVIKNRVLLVSKNILPLPFL